ncbi:MAG: hypothetical protein LBB52_06365 [Desulfovibrio sp.]|jgi:endonuclease YncB( thermonuclease family)|nr:hypothetical protein [Desulfovibrio sp.]
MILDAQNLFSKAQAVTATALSTNIVDLGEGDAGPSERLSLFVSAGPPFTVTGVNDATITVELQTADAATATDLTTPVTVASYPVSEDALKAGGKLLAARLPHGMKRYARLNYVVTLGSSTTIADGKITSGLVWDAQSA